MHARRRYGRAEESRAGEDAEGGLAYLVRGWEGKSDEHGRRRGGAHAHGKTRDDVRPATCDARLGDLQDRRIAEAGVILRHQDDRERCGKADQAAQGEVTPCSWRGIGAQKKPAKNDDPDASKPY